MSLRRTPLRPLTRILRARDTGGNPELIEAEELRRRQVDLHNRLRQRAETRLLVVGMLFFIGFLVVALRMAIIAGSEAEEPRLADSSGAAIVAARADIVDRNGRVMATNLMTNALYAQPRLMVDPVAAAQGLAAIFPDLDAATWVTRFTDEDRAFFWIKRNISPEQMQQVHDLGEPGLLFGPREMRLYPNGSIAAHVLGGAGYGREGVRAAEVVGRGGVEAAFDDYLRDPAYLGAPLQLSLDLSVQAATERVLYGGMRLMHAKGAAAVLMDVHTGEVITLASLPDFDPNARPRPITEGDRGDDPLFNRAVQGVYELGSTFKVFAIAQALELGLVNPSTIIDVRGPIREGGHPIDDFHDMGRELSVHDVLVRSSNVGTARIATDIGGQRQREFLASLGFMQATTLEMPEARSVRPLIPDPWRPINTMTISYGHGLSASPLHLAAAYATMVNGGRLVTPTLLSGATPEPGPQIIAPEVSATLRGMLRDVVASPQGTASFARLDAYAVGGKTGTADKPNPQGGYYEDKVITTFASVFPADDPQYVLIVTLDEPEERTGPQPRRTAGWTAVPVAAELIRRIAPLLDVRPEIAPLGEIAIPVAAN